MDVLQQNCLDIELLQFSRIQVAFKKTPKSSFTILIPRGHLAMKFFTFSQSWTPENLFGHKISGIQLQFSNIIFHFENKKLLSSNAPNIHGQTLLPPVQISHKNSEKL